MCEQASAFQQNVQVGVFFGAIAQGISQNHDDVEGARRQGRRAGIPLNEGDGKVLPLGVLAALGQKHR